MATPPSQPPGTDYQDISAALHDSEAQPAFRPVLLVAVLCLCVAAAVFWLGAYSQQHSAQPQVVGPFYAAGGAPAQKAEIMVQVSGAVQKPAVLKVAPGTSVEEAIRQAGGLTSTADTASLNLAAYVEDGSKIEVPDRRHPKAKQAAASTTKPVHPFFKPKQPVTPPAVLAANPVNINTATAQELEKLPKIGPVAAQKIVDYRKQNGAFHKVEDLQLIEGIGPKTFEKIRTYVKVR